MLHSHGRMAECPSLLCVYIDELLREETESRSLPGVCLGFAWGLPGVCLGLAWGLPGVCLGFAWGLPGVCLGLAWGLPPALRFCFRTSLEV